MTLTTISYRECIDIELLYRQKWALLRAQKKADEKDILILDGLLNYLDDLSDRVDPNGTVLASMEDAQK